MRHMSPTGNYHWLMAGLAAFLVWLALSAHRAHGQELSFDTQAIAAVRQCQRISPSCAAETKGALGVLVFPAVTKGALIIGGAGGKGALIEHNRITGYYELGSASIGLQAGGEQDSQIYVLRSAQALANLKNGPDWKAGASAGYTLVSTEDNARSVTGDVLVYVFNAEGLQGGVALDTFDIWQAGQ